MLTVDHTARPTIKEVILMLNELDNIISNS